MGPLLALNILIVPGTTRVGKEILSSLSLVKGLQIHGAGFDVGSGKQLPYDHYYFLDELRNENTKMQLSKIVEDAEIDLIFLAHDSWIFAYRNFDFLGSAQILSHPKTAIEIASFKKDTYSYFSKKIDTPIQYLDINDINAFPVFVKLNRGQGSVGSFLAQNQSDLDPYKISEKIFDGKWVVSEFLPGPEFTVDCFSNSDSIVIYSEPRIREKVLDGMAQDTSVVELSESKKWAKIISNELKLKGPWFFQTKFDLNGSMKLLEIGLRIAGASGITRLKGINLSLMAVYQSIGFDVKTIDQHTFPDVIGSEFNFNFYFEDIYVDLDDTIIVKDKLNQSLISFLIKMKKIGKKIFIITKNKGDVKSIILKFGIENLADEVRQISEKENKSEFILTKSPFIFIDDSFSERMSIKKVFGNSVLVLDQVAFEGRYF
jgi:carbamoylphosphate synthase large subunit